MRRGTTPTVTFTIPVDCENLEAADITFSNPGGAFISKGKDDMTKAGNKISVRLTQEETLAFRANSKVMIQCAIRVSNGTGMRSKSHEEPVEDALKGVPV